MIINNWSTEIAATLVLDEQVKKSMSGDEEPAEIVQRRTATRGVYYLKSLADIPNIPFIDDTALVEVPADLLETIPLKNHVRENGPRLKAVVQSVQNNGYSSVSPIVARIGRRGRWVVLDGGHRITAAKKVMKQFWPNLFGKKVRTLTFLLFKTNVSYKRYFGHAVPFDAETIDAEEATDLRREQLQALREKREATAATKS